MHWLLLLALFPGPSQVFDFPADAIVGTWENGSGKGHIEIYRQNGKYWGKIVWLRDANDATGRPKTDRKNLNPRLRGKPLIGLVIMHDFIFDDGEWTHGHIYNPSDGKEYKGILKMRDRNTLDVRGYTGIALIGKTDTWTRILKTNP